jgi:sugar phosphate isomerase/epimerase
VEDGHEAVRLAAHLQAESLIVHSGPRAGHTHNHARRLLTNALKDLLAHADEAGVMLALEPMHAQCAHEWTFLTGIEETVALIESIGHPRLKIAFDTYCFGLDEAAVDSLANLLPHLAVIQLGDARQDPDGEQERCPLGAGVIPLDTIVMKLLDAGYGGYFEIKLMGQEIETADYLELLQSSRRTVSRLLDGED